MSCPVSVSYIAPGIQWGHATFNVQDAVIDIVCQNKRSVNDIVFVDRTRYSDPNVGFW